METKYIRIQICLLLAVLLMLPVAVQAQQVFQYYTSFGYYDYTTNNGTVAIRDYQGSDTTLTIPDTINSLPVTSIGSDAFFQSPNLNSVTFGTNVTTIGQNAIFQCRVLSSVFLPDNVTNIGAGPLVDCQSLTVISLSTSNLYYSVTNGVLFNKTQTSIIEFPGGVGGSYTISAAVTNVGEAFIGNTLASILVNSTNAIFSSASGVLFNKNQTQLIEYPGSVTGSYAVPPSVTTIVSASFEYSLGVSTVTIGTSVTSIGAFAFYDSASLTAISVNAANSFYSSTNGVLFDKNKTQLIQYPIAVGGSYTVPSTVINIDDGAFGDAFSLTGVVIPDSVTNIGVETFYSCESLASVTIGNRVASIGQEAFFYCPDLTDVVIPAGVTSIGLEAFADCQSLANVCFEGNEPTDGGSIFYFDNALSTISYVNGTTGWGVAYDGIFTAPCATCGGLVPQLAIVHSGTNVILTWSADFAGFTLQSATNLIPPAVWATDTPAPVIINNLNTVTNSIAGTKKFYRLTP